MSFQTCGAATARHQRTPAVDASGPALAIGVGRFTALASMRVTNAAIDALDTFVIGVG